mmetsp:Transcript_15364/g.46312  ORF Transcript_15364/g.46312 Transcript_15364/m.46312 type:complete len:520 (-) Transcript_15364:4246-5805(-)
MSGDAPAGVAWPREGGRVSTTKVAKRVWTAAVAGLGAADGGAQREAAEALAKEIEAEADWRHRYDGILARMAGLMAASSEAAFALAEAGLGALYEEFRFVRGSWDGCLDSDELLKLDVDEPETITVEGEGEALAALEVPIEVDGAAKKLTGDVLKGQAQAWADYGCCEQSVATSVAEAVDLPREKWDLEGKVFVLLGGTSAFCPAKPLLRLGATVAVVSRPGSKIEALRKYAAGTGGTLLLPKLPAADGPGLDILMQLPELVAWVAGLAKAQPGTHFVLGSYVYLDGERHVRATMAMDATCLALQKQLGPERVSLAYLMSPATAHLWPEDAYEASQARWRDRGWWTPAAGLQQNSRLCAFGPAERRVFNGYVTVQGPNYALAKTLQLWRGILAHRNGHLVSANFAPPGRTASMNNHATMANLLNGMQAFEPLVVLQQDTASHFMTVLLIHDLSSATPASPAKPGVQLEHPFDLYTHNAFHGGTWRCAYSGNSVGAASIVLGYFSYFTGTAALTPEVARL